MDLFKLVAIEQFLILFILKTINYLKHKLIIIFFCCCCCCLYGFMKMS